ncbi:MAG: phage/plasmid primase, P4 family [Thermodesulfobacteriota bacterium]
MSRHSGARDLTRFFIEQVRSATDLVELIGETVQLKRSGREFVGLCPFHADKDPSLWVSPDKGVWYCFPCGAGGDQFTWVMRRDGLNFWAASLKLARRGNIDPPSMTEEQRQVIEQARTVEEIRTATARYYHSQLTPETRARLRDERGWTDETIDNWLIGEARGGLRQHLLDKGFQVEACIAAGALKRGEDGTVRDYFWGGRIVSPNIVHGRVDWMTGRSADGSDPKYLHIRGEKPLFNSDTLRSQRVVIVEGVTDVISLDQAGIPAVAVLGNSLKPEDVSRFDRCERLYACLDADNGGTGGGRNARIAEMFGARGRLVTLPDGQDPCSYLKTHTPADFRALLDSAKDPITAHVEAIPSDASGLRLRDELEPALKAISQCADEVRIEAYIKEIVKRFHLSGDEAKAYGKVIRGFRQQADEAHKAAADRKQFLPVELSYEVMNAHHLFSCGGTIYRYDSGVHQLWVNEEIDREIIHRIGHTAQSHHLDAVRKVLASLVYVRPEEINKPGLLNLRNCLLDIERGEQREHSPTVYSTVQVNVTFDPSARAPLWIQTLAEILPDAQARRLLSQFGGYCLVPHARQHKALTMVGSGSNGKGVFTDTMEALVGPEHTSALEIDDLKDKFRVTELHNRLINIASEVQSKQLVQDAMMKKVVSGDLLVGERKNRDPFRFRSFAKWIVACNELPASKDKSYGYFRRWLIVPFTQTFDETTRDPDRAQKIISTEMSGVLNWALLGYQDLMKEGRFSTPNTSKEALDEYRRDVNPVLDFVDTCLNLETHQDGSSLAEIHSTYTEWAKKTGRHSMSDRSLNKLLKAALNGRHCMNHNTNFYRGVAVTPLP